MHQSKIIFLIMTCFFIFFLSACDDPPPVKKTSAPSVVSGVIVQPVIQKESARVDTETQTDQQQVQAVEIKSDTGMNALEPDMEKTEKYDFQGKIDPFQPLIQEKVEEPKPVEVDDDRPKRILTPLEKIELSQIRLVAVIILKNRRIAMVEEASGKGYEIGIGTYIGKNQGRVSEIKDSSITITELVKDFKGRLKEHVQEIKLHKIENEE